VSYSDLKQFCRVGELKYNKGINRAWENIKENIKTSGKESLGLYELKQHQPWFSEESLQFLDQRSRLKCIGYRIQTKAV
jgi:hypothetical protein